MRLAMVVSGCPFHNSPSTAKALSPGQKAIRQATISSQKTEKLRDKVPGEKGRNNQCLRYVPN